MKYLLVWRLLVAMLLSAALVVAQGTVTFGTVETQGSNVMHLFLYLAGIGCILAIALGIFRCIGGRVMEGVLEIVAGVIFGVIIGNALNWGNTLTGQGVQ